jgi:hypothetical protein
MIRSPANHPALPPLPRVILASKSRTCRPTRGKCAVLARGEVGGGVGSPLAGFPPRDRASSRTRSCPTPSDRQCRYEAIRVWTYTTFIVIKAGDQQETSSQNLKSQDKINNNHDIHKTQS